MNQRKWLLITKDIIQDIRYMEVPPERLEDGIDTVAEDFKDIFKVGDTYDARKLDSMSKDVLANPDSRSNLSPTTAKLNVKTYGNIWVREVSLNKGDMKDGHKHEFDHLHFLSQGRVRIRIHEDHGDKPLLVKEYVAPAWIKVPKNHFHDVIALEDNTLGFCIQSVYSEDNEVTETDYRYDDDFMEDVKEYEREKGCPDEQLRD